MLSCENKHIKNYIFVDSRCLGSEGLSFLIFIIQWIAINHTEINISQFSASTQKSSHQKWKKETQKMYRLLTDILMSKTIQISLLEFLIFHNPKSADKVVRFISSFIFYDTFIESYGVASGDG